MWGQAVFLSLFIASTFAVQFGSYKIHPVPIQRINMPASLRWDDISQSLYFVNLLPNGTEPLFFRYDYACEKLYGGYIRGVSSVTFINNIEEDTKERIKTFTVGIGKDVVKIEWNGKSKYARIIETLAANLDKDNPYSNVFYAKTDPFGRLSVGTGAIGLCNGTDSGNEGVYNFGATGVQAIMTGISVSAATNFQVAEQRMYQLASCELKVFGYDWDESTGSVSNQETIFDLGTLKDYNPQYDIGFEMTIDGDGYLYVSMQSGRIVVIDPWKKKVIHIIKLPIAGGGGINFGGPQKKTLYVLAGQQIIDFTRGPDVTKFVSGKTSMYAITGLKARGPNVSRVRY